MEGFQLIKPFAKGDSKRRAKNAADINELVTALNALGQMDVIYDVNAETSKFIASGTNVKLVLAVRECT